MSLLILFPTGNTAENNKLTLPSDFVTMDIEGGSLRQHDGYTQGGYIHQATFPPPPFRGEVPVGELINGPDLATLVGLTAGTAYNDNEPWLHFVDPVDSKTKYISKKPYRHSLSWDELNAIDIVYGKQISIQGKQYICRLIKSSLTDPMDATAGYDMQPTWGSEWNRLMYPICAPTGNGNYDNITDPTSPGLGVWANYDQATDLELMNSVPNGYYTWHQETHLTNVTQRAMSGGLGVTRIQPVPSNAAHLYRGWRPLLELIE